MSAPGHEQIDVLHLGRPSVICCHRVGDVLVDPGPQSCEQTLLRALGGRVPRVILLTHIHLDHAGGAGALARRWPQVQVAVHERGARHLADPTRLVASARSLFGDEMERLWGEIAPVPEDRLIVLRGGETLDDLGGEGPWEVAYTPGHARHHVAYLHRPSRTLFAGDLAGMRIGDGPVMPPTLPPDIDLELWGRSLDTVEVWRPERVAVTHFGSYGDPERHFGELREALARFDEWARECDAAAFERRVREWIGGLAPAHVDAYFQGTPPAGLYEGLVGGRGAQGGG